VRSPTVLEQVLEANDSQSVKLDVVKPGGKTETPTVSIPSLKHYDAKKDGALTYALIGLVTTEHTPSISVGSAFVKTPGYVWDMGSASVHALTDRFSPHGIRQYVDAVTGKDTSSENRFVSVVGYPRLAADAVNAGWVTVLGMLIALNVFVGVFNLVPLLPFDGGHVAIAIYEKIASLIKRRPVRADVEKLLPFTAVVVGVLAVIFFTSVFLDIARPMSNPF
jgi:membrane-associated protease RseP (regulator of RpoE activity)